jgi:hypothetical protein
LDVSVLYAIHTILLALSLNWGNLNHTHASFGVSRFSPSHIESGLLFSGDRKKAQSSGSAYSSMDVGFFLGKWYDIHEDAAASRVKFSYGIQGDYRRFSNLDKAGVQHNPYDIGPYLGLSYWVISHHSADRPVLDVFARMSPVTYARGSDSTAGKRDHSWRFASRIMIGINYFFSEYSYTPQ